LNTVWTKYRVEFGTVGSRNGAYIGDTVKELHEAIDSDRRLDSDKGLKDILKHGYFKEFLGKNYETKDYVIDNCMHFMWTVR
jgi:hypothetical protein